MRVSVLDSMILDSEILRILEETLFTSINSFHLTRWTEEIKLLVKFILWKFSVYETGSSIGQSLLGLTFNCNKRKRQLILFFIFETILPYIYTKLKRRLTDVNHLYWKWLNTVFKSAQFLNLCIFIKNGYYPSLAYRFTQLMLIRRSSQEIPSSANYSSTQTRQLVWHYFADFLTIVLPIIKIHRIRSYISKLTGSNRTRNSQPIPRALSSTANSDNNEADIRNVIVMKCCYCKEDATIPIVIRNCRFCYYCFKANQTALESQNDVAEEEEVRRNLCTLEHE